MGKRSYSEAEKVAALLTLETNGGNVARTSRETHIPRKTIEGWRDGKGVNGDVADLRRENRVPLLERLTNELYEVLSLMPDKRAEAAYKDLVRAAGILVDKVQLLDGGATERVENAVTITAVDYRQALKPLAPDDDGSE